MRKYKKEIIPKITYPLLTLVNKTHLFFCVIYLIKKYTYIYINIYSSKNYKK
jgi:hypothetical protein